MYCPDSQKNGSILEVGSGSGSGEDGIFFQKRIPEIICQTSDPQLLNRKSRISWIEYELLNKNPSISRSLCKKKVPSIYYLRVFNNLSN